MTIYADKATLNLIPSPDASGDVGTATNPLRVRGGSIIPINLQFVDRVTPDALQTGIRYVDGTAIQWVLKLVSKYTGDVILGIDAFTRPGADTGFYTALLYTNTEEILNLLHDLDESADNDSDSITLAGEITILQPDADAPDRTQHIYIVIENFYAQDGETFTVPSAIIEEPSTGRTLALSDVGKYIHCTSSGAVTITVPDGIPWRAGSVIQIEQAGLGQVTIATSGSVAINSYNGWVDTIDQYAVVTLKNVGGNTWTLYGDLSA